MRCLAALALLLCTSLTACTGPVEPEFFELPEQPVASEAALPDWDHQPDAAPLPADPNAQPRLVLQLGPVTEDDDGDRYCPYRVEARNFPAVDMGGTTLVHVAAHVDGNSDGEDEYMLLSWLAPEQDTREQLVYDRGDDFDWSTDTNHCEQAIAELQAELDTINAELASRTWRWLERLDVVGPDAYGSWDAGVVEAIDALPLDRRPVEIVYRGSQFIARVRQAKVLLRLERPQWQREDEFCSRTPNMLGIAIDRPTGLALVSFDHASGGCLCDDHEYVDALRLPAELLHEVDRRPSSVVDG